MARTKEQDLAITIVDYRKCLGGRNPEPERRTKHFSDHQSYLRAMGELSNVDAHVREETRSTVRLYAEAKQADMFEGGGEKQVKDPSIEAFKEELRKALEEHSAPEAKTEAVNGVASRWDPRLGTLTDEERAPYNEAFREALMKAGREADAEAQASESRSQAADDILEGNTALDTEAGAGGGASGDAGEEGG